MNSSQPNPVLPTWIFIVTDLALIGAAAAFAIWSPQPWSAAVIFSIVACLALGSIAGLVPLVLRYERQKNEVLDERQQALEGLAHTVSSSADQLSIAAKGLHDIADLALKNLRMGEQLPHKLQDKIAEFTAQLAAAEDAEKEELERELLSLRTSESERLESVSQRIARASAEWTKLEATTAQHLAAANEAVARLGFGTASAIGKAQAAAEQALAQARVEAARSIGEASGNAVRALESVRSSALAEFEAKLSAAADDLVARIRHGLASHGDAPPPPQKAPAETVTPPPAAASTPPPPVTPRAPAEPTKRSRKARRDETDATETAASPAAAPVAATESPVKAFPEEPLPVPAAQIQEIAPVAPGTAEPFAGSAVKPTNGGTTEAVPDSTVSAPSSAARPPRQRSSRKVGRNDDEPALGLDLDSPAAEFSGAKAERTLTSDGATRLLVTAYIGIGNRLFIRGQGPGLSWERGVPLQFVSIGKWRWETNDASEPVRFKLYKNDDLECSALGALSLDPGHQQEVTAAF